MKSETGEHGPLAASCDRTLDAIDLDPDRTQQPDPRASRATITSGWLRHRGLPARPSDNRNQRTIDRSWVSKPPSTWSPYGGSVPLSELPTVERLTLARVTRVPEWHPEYGAFEPFAVYAWAIRHPDGVILVDTGIGEGHSVIDDWYGPEVVALGDALATVDLEIGDIAAVVLSHLHFDHCGQQRLVDAPVFVQTAEHAEAQRSRYTIAEWAAIPRDRLRLVDGDEEIVEGVHLVATPGHTPGHQSVVIDAREGRLVLGAQCAFRATEIQRASPRRPTCTTSHGGMPPASHSRGCAGSVPRPST